MEEIKINMEVEPEDKSRKNILESARKLGREKEVLLAFEKYDKLLKSCNNKSERDDIAKLGCIEIYKIINNTPDGTLTINYKKVI